MMPAPEKSRYPVTGIKLARRLKSAEAAANIAFIEAFGTVMARAGGVHCFLAEIGGRPAATAAMSLAGCIALLAGASTIPPARRQGAQLALLAARLQDASSRGANLAMMVAQPGSASQRNAERQGFRTAYARTKWRLRGHGQHSPSALLYIRKS